MLKNVMIEILCLYGVQKWYNQVALHASFHCLGDGDRDRLGGVLAARGGGDPRRTGDRDILLDAALGDLLLDLDPPYRGTALLGGGDLEVKKEKMLKIDEVSQISYPVNPILSNFRMYIKIIIILDHVSFLALS